MARALFSLMTHILDSSDNICTSGPCIDRSQLCVGFGHSTLSIGSKSLSWYKGAPLYTLFCNFSLSINYVLVELLFILLLFISSPFSLSCFITLQVVFGPSLGIIDFQELNTMDQICYILNKM